MDTVKENGNESVPACSRRHRHRSCHLVLAAADLSLEALNPSALETWFCANRCRTTSVLQQEACRQGAGGCKGSAFYLEVHARGETVAAALRRVGKEPWDIHPLVPTSLVTSPVGNLHETKAYCSACALPLTWLLC